MKRQNTREFEQIIAWFRENISGPATHNSIRTAFGDIPHKSALEGANFTADNPPEPVVHETHISIVFLTGPFVLKFKKPVDYGFISQTTLAERRLNCEREVKLNRRLAPDVYPGVLGVHVVGDGYALSPELENAVEFCVLMRRLDEEYSLKTLLARDQVSTGDMERVAIAIADFHRKCASGPAVTRLHDFNRNMRDNLEVLRSAGGVPPDLPARTEAYMHGMDGPRARREKRNRIIDGHGDLRPEHVYLYKDRVRIIDCVEFNPRIRAADPFEDLAFLTMALRVSGRKDLARILTTAYISATADAAGPALLPLFEIYRAGVRAKIDYLMLLDANKQRAEYYRGRFNTYLQFMRDRIPHRKKTGKRITVVMGMPASGKSTYARALSRVRSTPIISTDVVRKQILGLRPTAVAGKKAFAAAYAPNFTQRVYRSVAARARLILNAGYDVIVDGVFADNDRRLRLLRMAREMNIAIEFHWLRIDESTAAARLERRARGPSVSDLDDIEIWRGIRDAFQEPLDEIAAHTMEIPTPNELSVDGSPGPEVREPRGARIMKDNPREVFQKSG